MYGFSLFMDVGGNFIEPGFQLKAKTVPMQTTLPAAEKAEKYGKNSKTGATTILVSSTILNILLAGPL